LTPSPPSNQIRSHPRNSDAHAGATTRSRPGRIAAGVDAKIEHLSGGESAVLLAVQVALQKPDMLLLDERPTTWTRIGGLARTIPHTLSGYVVAVTHDRYFLDNAAEWILELDRAATVFHGRATTAAGSTRNRSAEAGRIDESARQKR